MSLQIGEGEFVAIEGPSGGGKSTLLNILGLLDSPDSGVYLLDGVDTASLSRRESARLRSTTLGFVFQAFHLLDRRAVIDSVELGLLYRGVRRSERRARAVEALEAVGLGDQIWQSANTLSGGQRQRVAIARVLASGAPLVLADEPTGNLDSENGDAVFQQLRALADAGATVVMVTHSHELAERADRVVTIKDGRIAGGSQRQAASPALAMSASVSAHHERPSTLRPFDVLRDAFESLLSRTGRMAGLVGSVALAVGLVVATLGIMGSARAQVSSQFDAHESRDVTVGWSADDFPAGAPDPDAIRVALSGLRGVGAVATLDDYDALPVAATAMRPALNVPVSGVSSDYPGAARLEVEWSRRPLVQLSGNEALVGKSLAAQLGLPAVTMRPTIEISGLVFSVVGVITSAPRSPAQTGAVLVGPDGVKTLRLADPQHRSALILSHTGAAQQIAHQAPLAVNPFRPSSVTVRAPVDPTTVRSEVEASVQTTLFILTGVSLLVAIASLTNAMSLSIGERKQEIGLRRALGARSVHIASLVSCEAAIVGFIGGLVGLLAGLGAVLTMTIVQGWSPIFDLRLAPGAIACGVLVGVLGSIVATRRAARIRPSDALRL
ncbi:ABC transporter ATP-binding protein/permease [Microbacterium protaetiae]|uniref:ABC transporter ATP-binding protein/permease n=1 Tax=Microbacterium protaetiae TaxID=2509458 RepID=UPI0013EDCE58|nr:ABC transporter ATP-binding protein/permease [Microbacterium protaetiae]